MAREFVAIWRPRERRNPTSHVFFADNLLKAALQLRSWLDEYLDCEQVDLIDGGRRLSFAIRVPR